MDGENEPHREGEARLLLRGAQPVEHGLLDGSKPTFRACGPMRCLLLRLGQALAFSPVTKTKTPWRGSPKEINSRHEIIRMGKEHSADTPHVASSG